MKYHCYLSLLLEKNKAEGKGREEKQGRHFKHVCSFHPIYGWLTRLQHDSKVQKIYDKYCVCVSCETI